MVEGGTLGMWRQRGDDKEDREISKIYGLSHHSHRAWGCTCNPHARCIYHNLFYPQLILAVCWARNSSVSWACCVCQTDQWHMEKAAAGPGQSVRSRWQNSTAPANAKQTNNCQLRTGSGSTQCLCKAAASWETSLGCQHSCSI